MLKYRLSNAQERIWYTQLKYKGSSMFNIGGTVRIKGNVDIPTLKQAIYCLIENNVALRLKFIEENNKILQYVSENKEYAVRVIDFSKQHNPEESYWGWCQSEAMTAFSLLNTPLYYFVIFKISDYDIGYFVKLHHIIADGWSMKLLTEQIAMFYESIITNQPCNNMHSPSYIDYVLNEANELTSVKNERAKKFWTYMFTPLPDISCNASVTNISGNRKSFVLDKNIFYKIEKYIKKYNISLNTLFICIYLLYEYKKYGKKDIVIGAPLLGRSGRTERQTFGTFVNPMPYRYIMDKDDTILDMLLLISSDLKKGYINQKYPYNLLCKDIKLNENGIERLYDVCINYYNTSLKLNIDDMPIENTEFYNGEQEYALQIIIRHWEENRLQLDFDYHTAVYCEKQIDEMYNHLMIILNQIIYDNLLKVKNLVLLTVNEKHKVIYKFNETNTDYPENKTWLNLFEDIVKSTPNKTAISKNNECLTYQELDHKANKLAYYLKSIGVQTNTIVGGLIEHNIESIVAILAIMKCGGIYLPIDVNNPFNRIKNILESSDAEYLIINDQSLIDFNGIIVSLKDIDVSNKELGSINFCSPFDTAYMIFTSGSTGTPKGVMISHRNLMNYLCWARKTYIKHENEVFALYSSFAFDFTMTSIFLPLISGGEIRIYDDYKNKNVFKEIINDNKATIVKITPSHIPLINDVDLDNSLIHTFIVGGENLKSQSCRKFYEHINKSVDIYNEYGPTEATIGCMTHLYNYEKDKEDSVPIGKPIDNVQIYLLDDELLPVADNTVGEIYISGESLSKGYYNLEDETSKRFIACPYINGSIMYKTGDRAYRNNEGMLVFCGRCDNEVKIRGNRVNLSEIEQKILSSDMAEDVIVTTFDCDNDSIQLCAYMLQNDKYSLEKLKKYLESHLPIYMLPQFYVCMDKFPLTLNGKIDKIKLPNPLTCNEDKSQVDKDRASQLDILITAISSVITDKDIAPNDNFYAIGGDSIKAIQISSRLNEKGYELSVRDILTNPIINNMLQFMKDKTKSLYEQGICSGEIMKTPILAWFFEQKFADEGHYNQSILLELNQSVSKKIIEKAFLELISHHDVLRLNYDRESDRLFYNNEHLNNKPLINTINLRDFKWEDSLEIVKDLVNKSFDLKNDLLIKVYLIYTIDKNYLYLSAHHLVVDGVSWRIIVNDLAALLSQISEEKTINLPDKSSSYQNYAKEYSMLADKYQIVGKQQIVDKNQFADKQQIAHKHQIDEKYSCQICEISKDNKSVFQIKSDNALYRQAKTLLFELNEEITENLLGKANDPYGTKPNELILIALTYTINDIYKLNKIAFEIESHGRDILEEVDINRTVGWFTSIYPIKIEIPPDEDEIDEIKEQIKSIKEQIRKGSKRGYEYGILRHFNRHANEHINKNIDKHINEQTNQDNKYIRFNYLGEYIEQKNDYFTLKKLLFDDDISPNNAITFLIDINAVVMNKKLSIYITYGANVFDENNINKLIIYFQKHIKNIVNHCINIKERIYTPSDFDMVSLTQEELDSLLE